MTTHRQDPELDKVIQEAQNPLAWLESIEQREKALEQYNTAGLALQSALAEENPKAELQKRHRALQEICQAHDFEIEEVLAEAYAARIAQLDALEKAHRRRRLLTVSLLVLTVLAATAGAGTWWTYRSQVQAAAAEIRAMMEADRLEAAGQYVQQLRAGSWIGNAAEIVALEVNVADAVRHGEQRRSEFRAALDAARASGPEHPDRPALAAARRLARTPAELAELEGFEAEIAAHLNSVHLRQEEEFLERLNSLVAEFAAFEQASAEALEPDAVQRLAARLQELDAQAPTPALAQEIASAQERLATLREVCDEGRRWREAEQRLVDCVGNHTRYLSAVRYYLDSFPKARLTADFTVAIAEMELWEGMKSWSDLAESFHGVDLAACTPEQAAAHLQRIAETKRHYEGYPHEAGYTEVAALLAGVQNRVPENGVPASKAVEEEFSDLLVSGVWMVEAVDGKRYYTPRELNATLLTAPQLEVVYLSDFNHTPRTITLDRQQIKRIGRAPQAELAEQVLRELRRLDRLSEWESVFFKISCYVASRRDLDPLLQFRLLRRTLLVGCRGSYPLQAGFDVPLRALSEPRFSLSVKWMDPNDADALDSRVQARAILEHLPDLTAAGLNAAQKLRAVCATRPPTYRWIGWLNRQRQGPWVCEHPPLDNASGRLVVIRRSGPFIELASCGQLVQGQVRLEQQQTGALLAGRPVYLEVASAAPAPVSPPQGAAPK